MDKWFTIERIDEKTFAISEYEHWEQVHSYLIIGDERAILLDTGLGVANIKETISELTALPVEVMTTHVHWDHIGGHSEFDKIRAHSLERSWLEDKFPLPLDVVRKNLMSGNCKFPERFNIDTYKLPNVKEVETLQDGDIISLGGRTIRVLHTPGHSPGHICLYEEETGYLFSGDLIYKGKLDIFYPTTNPIEFMQSINKVSKLQVKRILPGHYSMQVENYIIKKIQYALNELYTKDKLIQGLGVVKYDDFSIHL